MICPGSQAQRAGLDAPVSRALAKLNTAMQHPQVEDFFCMTFRSKCDCVLFCCHFDTDLEKYFKHYLFDKDGYFVLRGVRFL